MYAAEALSSTTNSSLPEAHSLLDHTQPQYVATEKHMVLYTHTDHTESASSHLEYCRSCRVHRNSVIEKLEIETNSSSIETYL